MPFEAESIDQSAERMTRETGIPPCPAILTRLLREIRADDPDFRRIGQLIGGDVALAAATVNIANSPFYALRTKAASVQQALVLLGLDAVAQRVTGLLLRQAFPAGGGPAMERYWKTSTATAHVAGMISRETRRGDAETSHTYGLFQNCGMAVMLQKFPIYADILDGTALEYGDPVGEIEEERYATTHAKIGAQLARNWQLPDALCSAILHHHDLPMSEEIRARASEDSRILVAVGVAAEQIRCTATGGVCPEWDQSGDWVLEELGISVETLADISGRIVPTLKRI